MKKYLTKKYIGMALSILIALPILMSSFGKLSGNEDTIQMLSSHNLKDWIIIIGIGELISIALFLIPKIFPLGSLLLSAYFGGAIMFHMSHPNPEMNDFMTPSIFLIMIWVASWARGLRIYRAFF